MSFADELRSIPRKPVPKIPEGARADCKKELERAASNLPEGQTRTFLFPTEWITATCRKHKSRSDHPMSTDVALSLLIDWLTGPEMGLSAELHYGGDPRTSATLGVMASWED